MEITNRQGFPEALVKAVQNDSYTKGDSDYSVTELLQPPRMVALKAKHRHEMVDDVEDRLWSLYGQIAHLILERANEADLVEQRFSATFKGKTVSGQVDNLSLVRKLLSDWKFTTAWKFKANSPPDPDWVSQLNMQTEILRRNGYDVERARIIGLLRDWSKLEALRASDYPQKGVAIVPIPLWERDMTVAFIEERVALMEQAKSANRDEDLPLCTGAERWAKQDIWAVMKGDRAIKMGLCFSEDAAKKMHEKNPGTRIEFRPGQSPRCEAYCSVSKFCTQFQRTKGAKNEVQKGST